ncbi:MAG: exo-alpha-sialidase [bacterium]
MSAGELYTLWDPEVPVPKSSEAPLLPGVRFSVIKERDPDKDGYNWLHGVALAWHKGALYASFGHNKGAENTASEEARGRVSADGGRTWSEVFTIDTGEGENLAVSHGVLLVHTGTLWAFCGSFYGKMQKVHMRAYTLDEKTNTWVKKGMVAGDGFWPMGAPQKMSDGNWIVAGISVRGGYGGVDPAAVAISDGDDLTKWDVVVIPLDGSTGKMWGEAAALLDGREITCIARYGAKARALAAASEDFGRTWTQMRESNLPMATSKAFAGKLSTGQCYLVCTTTADSGGRRSPLTIAVSRPGEKLFFRVYRIRDAEFDGAGESHPGARLSYPYAVEHNGKLYVAYSNDGGRGGNRNSAELAVIPIETLSASRE